MTILTVVFEERVLQLPDSLALQVGPGEVEEELVVVQHLDRKAGTGRTGWSTGWSTWPVTRSNWKSLKPGFLRVREMMAMRMYIVNYLGSEGTVESLSSQGVTDGAISAKDLLPSIQRRHHLFV